MDLDSLPLPELFARLTADGALDRLLVAARAEDLGSLGDVTTASIVEPGRTGRAALGTRAAGVVAGLAATPALLHAFGGDTRFEPATVDGAGVSPGATLGTLTGSLAALLAVERTLLNLVGHLSGIATRTRVFVDAVAGTRALVCATRKTTPGLRGLEKYAVRCGGGAMHRMGLFDAALYKDNHLAGLAPDALGAALAKAIAAARTRGPLAFVEVEVDRLDQLASVLALETGLVDMILLDNMGVDVVAEAIAMRDAGAPGIRLEVSGAVDESTVRAYAETGVDRISVGALTHSAPALDVAMEVTGS